MSSRQPKKTPRKIPVIPREPVNPDILPNPNPEIIPNPNPEIIPNTNTTETIPNPKPTENLPNPHLPDRDSDGVIPNPFSKDEWNAWSEKGRSHIWEKCPLSPEPSVAIFHSEKAYTFFETHDWLISRGVQPVDNIYGMTPCRIVEKRRFNLPLVHGHLVHSDRKPNVRKLSVGTGFWKKNGKYKEIAGRNGVAVGKCYPLVYCYKPSESHPNPPEGNWYAEEYVSAKSDNKTSVVKLICSNPEWIDVELAVEKAEENLDWSHQRLLDAQNANKSEDIIRKMLDSVTDKEAVLGLRIAELQSKRGDISRLELELSGVTVVAAEQEPVENAGNVGSVNAGEAQIEQAVDQTNVGDVNAQEVRGDFSYRDHAEGEDPAIVYISRMSERKGELCGKRGSEEK